MTDYRALSLGVYVLWDGVNWTDESANVVTASGELALVAPASAITSPAGTTDRLTLTLRNPDNRYSTLVSSSALYAYIVAGLAYQAPVYVNITVNGAEIRLFTGVLKLSSEQILGALAAPQVTFDVRSRDELLLNQRLSTAQGDFTAWADAPLTEADLIVAWLSAAGMVDGEDFVTRAYCVAHTLDLGLATIDQGRFTIPWAWLDDEAVTEEIWRLAAACGGRLYTNEWGIFHYENMAHWALDDSTPTAIDDGAYVVLDVNYEDNDLYSSVTVEIAGREFGESAILWQPDAKLSVPPGGSITITAKLNQPVYGPYSVTYNAITPGARDISGDVSIDTTGYAQHVDLTFSNANADHMALLRNVALIGVPVDSLRAEEVTQVSSNAFWTGKHGRNRRLSGNPYIQNRAQAQMLAEFLRDRSETPHTLYTVSGAALPAVPLGGKISLNDTHGMSIAHTALIIARSWSFGPAGFAETVKALDALNLYLYAAPTSPSYFVIGTSTLGALSATPGVLFY